jgi:hypothetical protein
MAGGVTVKDNREVYDRIRRELAKLRKAVITVGVHAEDASRDEGGMANNAYIGAVHEFGAGNVPERSFLRPVLDNPRVIEQAQENASKVAHGELRARVAVERIGIMAADQAKRNIRAKIAPPLAASTVERRLAKGAHGGGAASHAGEMTPLIDTGQLINSIQYRIGGGVAGWGSASRTTTSEAGT